jgi:hypothetical protein
MRAIDSLGIGVKRLQSPGTSNPSVKKVQPKVDSSGNNYRQQQQEKQQLEETFPPKPPSFLAWIGVPLAH